MLLCFFLFIPLAAAAPTELGAPTAVLETAKTAIFAPDRERTSNTYSAAPSELETRAGQIAAEYGIPKYAFVETMRNESMNFTNLGQSQIPANGPNGREDSWGICQIHLPSHPTITREQAMNPEWCLRWSAQQFKAGRASMWSEYRKL